MTSSPASRARAAANGTLSSSAPALRSWAALAGLGAFIAAGCADVQGRADPIAAAREWCPAFCSLRERCLGEPAAACTTGCISWSQPYMRRTVTEAIETEAACLGASTDCSDMDAVFAECFEQAGLAAPPSSESDRFCTQMSETFFECRWFDSPEACSQINARYTAPALRSGERCSTAACEELEQCIETSLWTYGQR